jgi:glycosyltransferase involved in cell wall biosynthesis
MIGSKCVCVIMPAYNAGRTLRRTTAEIDGNLIDEVILADDASKDDTVKVAQELLAPASERP